MQNVSGIKKWNYEKLPLNFAMQIPFPVISGNNNVLFLFPKCGNGISIRAVFRFVSLAHSREPTPVVIEVEKVGQGLSWNCSALSRNAWKKGSGSEQPTFFQALSHAGWKRGSEPTLSKTWWCVIHHTCRPPHMDAWRKHTGDMSHKRRAVLYFSNSLWILQTFIFFKKHLHILKFCTFSKKSLSISKLHVLWVKTGLNSPTFKVRNKFGPNLLTYLILLTHPPTHSSAATN